jgi:hypothetical protein
MGTGLLVSSNEILYVAVKKWPLLTNINLPAQYFIMKAVTMISAVLFMAITITAITLTYQAGMPVVKRLSTAATVDAMKDVFTGMDSVIREVASGSQGFRRKIYLNMDPGRFVVNSSSDQVYWMIETDAGVVSPRSKQEFGNAVLGSNLNVRTYSGNHNLTPAWVLENEHLMAYIRIVGTPSSYQSYSTSQLLLGLYSKDLDKWMDGGIDLLVDGNPATSTGSGYTYVRSLSDDLPSAVAEAYMESTLNYTVYFTLDSGADFLIIEAEVNP